VPIFDWKCDKCKLVEEKFETRSEIEIPHTCPKCGSPTRMLFPSTMDFRLIYDNKKDMVSWGAEGYSTSRYWEAVNAEREKEGKIQVQVPR